MNYVNDTAQPQSLEWIVTMLGPTGVGKTSIVSTLYEAAKQFYKGKPVRVRPSDTDTEEALIENNELMTSELERRRFAPAKGLATVDPVSYKLTIELVKGGDLGLGLTFLDFPGGWVNDRNPEHKASYQHALEVSSAVILPIDAVALMRTPESKIHWRNNYLQKERIKHFVEHWAKHRAASENKDPALLILAPVKCETFFKDNGGDLDRSNELFARTKEVYREIIATYKDEYGAGAQILYAPIDTIGCIELEEVSFPEVDGKIRMVDHYRVRGLGHRRILGAEPILAHLVKDVLELGKKQSDRERILTNQMKLDIATDIEGKESDLRKMNSNWFVGIFNRIVGNTRRVKRELGDLQEQRAVLSRRLGGLEAQLQGLVDAISSQNGEWNRQRSL